MTRICAIACLGAGICWAQQAVPRAEERTAAAADPLEPASPIASPLHRYTFQAVPIQIEPPTARQRPAGESVSVAQLQHKVPKAARRAFARATKLSKAEDDEGAARELETAVRIDPEFAGAYRRLGIEYGILRRPSDAAIVFRRLLKLAPDSVDARCYLGLALFDMGDHSGAEEQFRLGLRESPGSANCQLFLGYLEFQDEARRADGVQRMQSAGQTLPYARKFVRSLR